MPQTVAARSAKSVKVIPACCVLLIALAGSTTGAERSIAWVDAVCDWKIHFDPGKVDARSMRDTVDIVFSEETERRFPGFLYFTTAAEAKAMDLDAYRQQCDAWSAAYNNLTPLDIPEVKYYQAIRSSMRRESCDFEVLHLRAARGDWNILRAFLPAKAACGHFVDALDGQASLTDAWAATVEETCTRSIDPEACVRTKRDAHNNDPTGSKTKLFVLQFGWYTCANHLRLQNTIDHDTPRQAAIARLKRRFPIQKGACDPGD
jgi:hypothetical protein